MASLITAAISFLNASVASAASNGYSGAGPAACCFALSLALSSKVSFPTSPGYTGSLTTYFSNQEKELHPTCIVLPTVPQDVATAVEVLSHANVIAGYACPFAIKSGGHTPFAGSANIDSGITIDLGGLNEITVSPDRTLTTIGAGQRWSNVYLKLDPLGLSVVGGKSGLVGIGGITTGGGMSAFSPRFGFICDNVVIFETVLPDGRLVNVTQTSYPDVWLALKGGSNNFGIVTRFIVRTFNLGQLWGGSIYYDISTAPQQLKAFNNCDLSTGYDEYAIVITSFGFTAQGSAAVNTLEYTKPVVNPPSLQPFTAIQPQFINNMRLTNYSDLAIEQSAFNAPGLRQLFVTTTFVNDLNLLTAGYEIWNATIPALAAVPSLSYSITYQPLPPAMTSKSAALGGNILGLDSLQKALVVVLITATWSDPSNDVLVEGTSKQVVNDIDAKAKAANLYHPFKYLNYADRGQDVFDGYGAANKAKLQATSKKYDPHQIFQKAVPGGFKLFP